MFDSFCGRYSFYRCQCRDKTLPYSLYKMRLCIRCKLTYRARIQIWLEMSGKSQAGRICMLIGHTSSSNLCIAYIYYPTHPGNTHFRSRHKSFRPCMTNSSSSSDYIICKLSHPDNIRYHKPDSLMHPDIQDSFPGIVYNQDLNPSNTP